MPNQLNELEGFSFKFMVSGFDSRRHTFIYGCIKLSPKNAQNNVKKSRSRKQLPILLMWTFYVNRDQLFP